MVKQPCNQATRHAWFPGWRLQHTSAPMRSDQTTKPRLGVPKPRLGVPKLRLGVPEPRRGAPTLGLRTPGLGLRTPNLGLGTSKMSLALGGKGGIWTGKQIGKLYIYIYIYIFCFVS